MIYMHVYFLRSSVRRIFSLTMVPWRHMYGYLRSSTKNFFRHHTISVWLDMISIITSWIVIDHRQILSDTRMDIFLEVFWQLTIFHLDYDVTSKSTLEIHHWWLHRDICMDICSTWQQITSQTLERFSIFTMMLLLKHWLAMVTITHVHEYRLSRAKNFPDTERVFNMTHACISLIISVFNMNMLYYI
jgi:hypothetical protein